MKATIAKFLAFIIVCSGFTAYLIVTIGNIRPFERTYGLSATFDDVTGLLPNDNVKVAGVVVGKVTGIEVDTGKARVSFQVRDGVDIPVDSSAAVRWRNLLGQRYLYIYPGDAEQDLQSGDHIEDTVAVVDLGELFNRLGPIVKAIDPADVNTFLDAVVGALDGNEEKIRQALDDLARFAGALGDRDAAISHLVTNLDTVAGTITARDQEIRTVLDNLLAITATFNDNTDVLDRAVTELDRFSTNFGGLLEDNRAHIDNILNNLTRVVEVVRTKLPTLDATLGNVDELSVALFHASRYGEWLNQVIYCGAIGRSAVGEALVGPTDCTLPVAGGSLPSSSTGASSLVPLISGAGR